MRSMAIWPGSAFAGIRSGFTLLVALNAGQEPRRAAAHVSGSGYLAKRLLLPDHSEEFMSIRNMTIDEVLAENERLRAAMDDAVGIYLDWMGDDDYDAITAIKKVMEPIQRAVLVNTNNDEQTGDRT